MMAITTSARRSVSDRLRAHDILPDLAVLQRLRIIFLAYALFHCGTMFLVVFVGPSTRVELRAAAFVSIVLLCARWVWGYQRQSFLWPPLDIVEAVALLLVGVAAGASENSIGFFYAAIMFRSLYGSRFRAAVRVVMILAAFAVVSILSPHPTFVTDFLAPLFGLLFTAMVARVIGETLRSHGRALKRERILRQLGAMLGRFRDNETMHASVLAALHALGGDDTTVRVSIWQGNADDMAVVAIAGDDPDSIRGGHCTPVGFPSDRLQAIEDKRIVRATNSDSGPVPVNFVGKKHAIFAPLIVGGELIGMLVLSCDHAIAADLDEVLTTLGSQVSMWLEGQAADGMLREKDRERGRLLRHLVIAQEDERKLIAGDIHDDSIQVMAAVAIRLSLLRKHLTDASALETLAKVAENVTSSIGRLRSLMFRLRPPSLDEEGLAAALRQQLSETAEVRVQVGADVRPRR
jgi:signal transduction histidine kinase